jgi:2-polyprenyl-3-methyl-5-hydroxy-6-metoxy-1,4-benzoquinol methylase
VAKKPIVILGEYHGSKSIIQLQTAIQKAMLRSPSTASVGATATPVGAPLGVTNNDNNITKASKSVRVIFEHFSMDMQPLLDSYLNHFEKNDETSENGSWKHNNEMAIMELLANYNNIGTEQHDLVPYIPLLESARNYSQLRHDHDNATNITLHGGFIPRSYARQLHTLTKEQIAMSNHNNSNDENIENSNNVKQNHQLDSFLQQMKDLNYISPTETLHGTNEHYNYFESLFTQRNIQTDHSQQQQPSQRFRTLFPSQILKDASMAWTFHSLFAKNFQHCQQQNNCEQYFIICGIGHMLYSHGVPERILSMNQEGIQQNTCNEQQECNVPMIRKDDILRIACLPVPKGTFQQQQQQQQQQHHKHQEGSPKQHQVLAKNDKHDSEMEIISNLIHDAYGNADAADVCFIYEEEIDDDEEEEIQKVDDTSTPHTNTTTNDTEYYIQQETKDAYDKVGSTASNLQKGDIKKAHAILQSLHYTNDEIAFVGLDAVNYQGVGCPHRHAHIQNGESVLDMGSGLGVDSMIALHAVGENGSVVGIDLSSQCVHHSNQRARERKIESNISFVHSPIEDIGNKLNNESVDVIISNGAFCLLPDKTKGFKECFRLLKGDGRIAICTTVIQDRLKDNIDWPLCMQTFAHMNEIKPMLEEIGFADVHIDLSDSLMEIQVEENGEDSGDDEEDDNNDVGEDGNDDKSRYKVHNEEGRKRYVHLENFDMNQLCARITITARKPST